MEMKHTTALRRYKLSPCKVHKIDMNIWDVCLLVVGFLIPNDAFHQRQVRKLGNLLQYFQ